MSALYDPATGVRTPCTILQLERNEVLALKTRDKHGYWAVQVGAGWKHPSNVTRAMLGHFAAAGTSPKRWVSEFRVRDEGGLVDVGKGIGAGWWREGGWVDVRSTGRGMGFEGVSFTISIPLYDFVVRRLGWSWGLGREWDTGKAWEGDEG
jgi:large subunit ribosomal protein L3